MESSPPPCIKGQKKILKRRQENVKNGRPTTRIICNPRFGAEESKSRSWIELLRRRVQTVQRPRPAASPPLSCLSRVCALCLPRGTHGGTDGKRPGSVSWLERAVERSCGEEPCVKRGVTRGGTTERRAHLEPWPSLAAHDARSAPSLFLSLSLLLSARAHSPQTLTEHKRIYYCVQIKNQWWIQRCFRFESEPRSREHSLIFQMDQK